MSITWQDVFGGKYFEVPSTDVEVNGVSHLSGEIEVYPDTVEMYVFDDTVEVYFMGEFTGDGLLNDEPVIVTGKIAGHVITNLEMPESWQHYDFDFIEEPYIAFEYPDEIVEDSEDPSGEEYEAF